MTSRHPIELFMPPNMLKAKLGGGSGGSDIAALQRAQEALESLSTEFAGWLADDVKALVDAGARYGADPGDINRAALLRAAHDIKGQAATFDFPLMARVAGSLSRLLHEAPEESPLPPKLIGAHVVAIQAIHRQAIAAVDHAPTLALLAELESQVGAALKA